MLSYLLFKFYELILIFLFSDFRYAIIFLANEIIGFKRKRLYISNHKYVPICLIFKILLLAHTRFVYISALVSRPVFLRHVSPNF